MPDPIPQVPPSPASDAARASVREHLELERLPATWLNVERLLHDLWGDASRGVYHRHRWAAFQSMLARVKWQSR